jgi:hypothetical protein
MWQPHERKRALVWLKNVSDNSIILLLGIDLVIGGMSGHLTVWSCATGGLKPKQMKDSDVM